MLSQHSDHSTWRGGKQEGGGSEMGGLKFIQGRTVITPRNSLSLCCSASLTIQLINLWKYLSKCQNPMIFETCALKLSMYLSVFQNWNYNNGAWGMPAWFIKESYSNVVEGWHRHGSAAVCKVTFPLNWPRKKHLTLSVKKAVANMGTDSKHPAMQTC